MRESLKWTYKVLRTLLFSLIIAVVSIIAILFGALAIPGVQNAIKERAQKELAIFLGSEVEISKLTISPFNEVVLNDAIIYDLSGKECLKIGKLGAGINLWKLLLKREIEITYVELLDFDASIYQVAENSPLNIDFIIKAFQPKDKNKPPTRFDLKIRNIVLRNGNVAFARLWKPAGKGSSFDSNRIEVSDLCADVVIPRLSNDLSTIDIRRLSFYEKSGFQLKEFTAVATVTPKQIDITDFELRLPQSQIKLEDFTLPLALFSKGHQSDEVLSIKIYDSHITPSNLSAFLPTLSGVENTVNISANIAGTLDFVTTNLNLDSPGIFRIKTDADLRSLSSPEVSVIEVQSLEADIEKDFPNFLASLLSPGKDLRLLNTAIGKAGKISLGAAGKYAMKSGELKADVSVNNPIANLSFIAEGILNSKGYDGNLDVVIGALTLSDILPESVLSFIAGADFGIKAHLNFADFMKSAAEVNFNIDNFTIAHRNISNLTGRAAKHENLYEVSLAVADDNLNGTVEATAELNGVASTWSLDAQLNDFDTYNSLLTEERKDGYEVSGRITASATGNSPDNLTGTLNLHDFNLVKDSGKSLHISDLNLSSEDKSEHTKTLTITSDIADFSLTGDYVITKIIPMLRQTVAQIVPSLGIGTDRDTNCGLGAFNVNIKDASQLIAFFNVPVAPLTEITLSGNFDSANQYFHLDTDIPYIKQGKNNLVTGTYLDLTLDGLSRQINIGTGTVYPTKKGLLKFDLALDGQNDNFLIHMDFNKGRDVMFYGSVEMKLLLDEIAFGNRKSVRLDVLPSELYLNDARWKLDESSFIYTGDALTVNDFSLRHENQFLLIDGYNDNMGEGTIYLRLSDIDLDYLFDTLNINHVVFGGLATGTCIARDIFGKDPEVHTEKLFVKNLSYYGAVLGDGDVRGWLDLPAKMVGIGATVTEDKDTVALIDGGVWFGKDSLAFAFDANKVDVGFIQPFMKAFSSEVTGRASGKAQLYGTFSDIDMTGTLVAHDVRLLIDYINTRYLANDTINFYPGRIEINDATVEDKFGNTAVVNGVITHQYFHEPTFDFTLSDIDKLLVYDTNARMNALWYGKIFASGYGKVTGYPGFVNISADVRTEPGSDFTFVLSDQQEAVKSHFLTFSDRRKEAEIASKAPSDTIPDFLKSFNNPAGNLDEETSDIFTLDLRASVTDDITLNLIMDPVAGDKIVARGDGAMTMNYSSLTDELRLYGKYVLEKGYYNFSLQDIILKDFTIKPGSSIAFTGDPYTGVLDITAAYRVNTSLTELDRSFAADRELNRTNVPVEALLKVTGVLTSPNIAFDIELPTVTEETARKVRSIISTDDMMNRQILYLVALNKFYPPEYMSTGNNTGGEWASMASSTLSSQLQNAIGQITDKFTIAPSIRSDKGDFSDIEVDLALSSQLFNNRLFLNGNLGYRDPSNSSTTFVGDFDLEYLLNKKGTWRLKAYNHFNDQNYYLKSALTTQGIGIVWRKEFGKPTLLRPEGKKPDSENETEPSKK